MNSSEPGVSLQKVFKDMIFLEGIAFHGISSLYWISKHTVSALLTMPKPLTM